MRLKRLFATVALSLIAGVALGGDNTVKLCRTGTDHGETCTVDGNCAGGGICTKLGHPRRCSWQRHCLVSGTPCQDNADCPLYPYGICPNNCNAADYCAFPNFSTTVDCTTDADCGTCAGGTAKGLYCDADNDCPSSTCTAASGTCINGIEQGQLYWGKAILSGLSGDLVADSIIGGRMIEDAPPGSLWGTTDYFQPSGVDYDSSNGDVYIHDITRVLRLPAVSTPNAAADLALCQPTLPGPMLDDRLPGDITQGAMGATAANACGWTLWGGAKVWRSTVGAAEGIWVVSRYGVLKFPLTAVTGDAATKVLGFTSTAKTARSAYLLSDNLRGPAMLDRCVGGASIGVPCDADGDCAASTCETTLCVTDEEYNRTPCWRDVGNAANGANPDFVLGQDDTANATNGCNTGGRDATTQCGPNGVAIDPTTGEIWVSDTSNYRALRYPLGAVTNTSANRVLGQALFTTATAGSSSTGLNAPLGIAVSFTGSNVAIADSYNNRIKVHMGGVAADNEAADAVLCQPDMTSNGSGRSSDGTLCDRCNRPTGIAWTTADHLWVADGGPDSSNRRTFRFVTPDITGSGTSAATALLQGQPTCNEGTLPVNGARFSGENTGAMGGMAESATGRFLVTDPGGNRALWWNSATLARTGETLANGVLGQALLTDKRVNRGGSCGSNTLSGPRGAAYTSLGATSGLHIADTNNNRIAKYLGQNWTTGQNMSGVYGHSGSTTNCTANQHGFATSTNGARNLNAPEGVATDDYGNMLAADTGNGRVLLFCNVADTVDGFPDGTFICVAGNSGDDIADAVLGKASMTDTANDCAAPAATTLCRPVKVESSGATKATYKIIVSDIGNGNQSGRVLIYQAGNWITADQPAAVVLGARPLAGQQYTSYGFFGRGTCELDGISQQLECNYVEGEGVAAGFSQKTCTGGSSTFSNCTTDANCPSGANAFGAPTTGMCGCPSLGYCLHRRTIGEPYGLAYDDTNDILYVAANGGINQFIGPLFNNSPARARALKGNPHAFYSGFGDGSFIETSYGGFSAALASDLELDSNGNLYSGVGPLYGWGVLSFDNPLPATNTPTVTVTRTRTFTPTVTNTPTNTPTITDTPVGSTPTNTPTPTSTPTPTFTLTRTLTATATATNTGATPTVTLTPIPATPTTAQGRRFPVPAEMAFIPTGSSCAKVDANWTEYGSQVVRCPTTGNPTFFVKFYVVPAMPRNPMLVLKGRSAINNSSQSAWQVSNVVLRATGIEADAFDANLTELGAGINYTMDHLPPGNAPAKSDTGQQFVLFNGGKAGVCNTDDECDNMVGYLKITRLSDPPTDVVDLEVFVFEY